MFEPENELEVIMQKAARDPAAIPDFYRTLLKSEIYILTPEARMEPGKRRALKYQEAVNIATVDYQGLKWHPAFTAKSRIAAYIKEPETCLGAEARNLFPSAASARTNFVFLSISFDAEFDTPDRLAASNDVARAWPRLRSRLPNAGRR